MGHTTKPQTGVNFSMAKNMNPPNFRSNRTVSLNIDLDAEYFNATKGNRNFNEIKQQNALCGTRTDLELTCIDEFLAAEDDLEQLFHIENDDCETESDEGNR